MTLTMPGQPLSTAPPDSVNYTIEGPDHRLLLTEFPRRVRGVLAGTTVLDSRRGKLLYESGALPELCIPVDDIYSLRPNGRHETDQFKGSASRFDVWVGDRVAEDAAYSFDPPQEASWLRGYVFVEWDAMDHWLDEDEEVQGHLRDPYHRVDVRRSSGRVHVEVDGLVIADSRQPMLLSETGLANRYYVPPADVRIDALRPSTRTTVCPYKGTASYWSVTIDGRTLEDAAWSYPEPLENASKIPRYVAFDHPELRIHVSDT